jgi:uncharacterized repeat protein (TIGR03803 family)
MGRRALAARVLAGAFVLMVLATQMAQGQTFDVLHTFDGQNGRQPWSGLAIDRRGNLYGTTFFGGAGYGIVFKLTPSGSGWTFSPLYSFQAGNDGAYPYAGVTIGPDGALYGATYQGGGGACNLGCGTVYRVSPPATPCKTAVCPWNETVLYHFGGGADGANPFAGLVFDQAGKLYGTTTTGGLNDCGGFGCGVVYELTPSGGGWIQSVIHSFVGGSDGSDPKAGLVLDTAGNVYGTTVLGGAYNNGTVFQLQPSGSGWVENVLYSFTGGTDGGQPTAGLILDSLGNLYGGSAEDGTSVCKVFEMSSSNGNWSFALIYSFTYLQGANCARSLALDSAGNLYGTTAGGGTFANGVVFELSPSGGTWTYAALHEFDGPDDGEDAYSTPVFDGAGNLYGTTSIGGTHGSGVIFEITP